MTKMTWARIGRALLAVTAAGFATVTYTWLAAPDVRPLRRQPPSSTAFMRLRAAEAREDGRPYHARHRWVAYGRISPALARAVRVTEDAAFWEHDGLDLGEIRASIEDRFTKGTPLRGASTITQQLAKNLYLSPARNPYRKLSELVITRRLEAELTKTRILELYLNLIEWGDGIWGAEAAAQAYFGVSASDLSIEQAALLAAAIANPRVYNPARPSNALLRRQQRILTRMGATGAGT
jgi:monofunctional biosynthetic peptidoglycan transglycosylase